MSDTATPSPLAAAVILLDRAEQECTALGGDATASLEDLTTWHLDANLVRIAADTLRSATSAPLPELPVFEGPTGLDPLRLLLTARDELRDVPDKAGNPSLFLGWIRLSTALFAVRSHYE